MRIEIDGLTKWYGDFAALDEVTITFAEGMNGLLGANGAGKTTLMKILVGVLDRTSGEIRIDGVDMTRKKVLRKNIGYIPQKFSFYPGMSTFEIMDYFCALNQVKRNRKAVIHEIIEKVHLSEYLDLKIRELSGGMVQRLGIAVSLIKNPKILVLDEPTAGLDPKERRNFNQVISSLAEGRIILLSSHIVSDIEATCQDIAILNHGRVLFSGCKENLIRECLENMTKAGMEEKKPDLTDAYVYKVDMDDSHATDRKGKSTDI